MIALVKLTGLSLLVLVGYHYVNQPLGFSVAGSFATVVFGVCLMTVYRGYVPDGKNWTGWSLIAVGCLWLATFGSFRLSLLLPVVLIVFGFRLTELEIDMPRGGGGGWGSDGGGDIGDSCGGGDGGCGD
jgi:hypothetical protein